MWRWLVVGGSPRERCGLCGPSVGFPGASRCIWGYRLGVRWLWRVLHVQNAGCARRASVFRVLLVVSLAADMGVGWLWRLLHVQDAGCGPRRSAFRVLLGVSVASSSAAAGCGGVFHGQNGGACSRCPRCLVFLWAPWLLLSIKRGFFGYSPVTFVHFCRFVCICQSVHAVVCLT